MATTKSASANAQPEAQSTQITQHGPVSIHAQSFPTITQTRRIKNASRTVLVVLLQIGKREAALLR